MVSGKEPRQSKKKNGFQLLLISLPFWKSFLSNFRTVSAIAYYIVYKILVVYGFKNLHSTPLIILLIHVGESSLPTF